MCVCVSLQSHNCSRSRFLPLSRKLRCVRVCVCVCVYTDVFFRARARRTFPKRRKPEKRDFFLTVFPNERPTTFSFSFLSGWSIPYNPRTQTLISVFRTKIIESRKFVPKTSQQHSSSPTQFEKSLEDERNVSPRDVITRRATTTSSGARRCC